MTVDAFGMPRFAAGSQHPYAGSLGDLGQEGVIRNINQSQWRGYAQHHPTPNRPPPITGWRAVLGACADLAAVNAAYHRLAQSAHPDHGGSTERMVALTAARDAARKELSR